MRDVAKPRLAMERRTLSGWIDDQDHWSRLKHEHFRRAGEAVAAAFSTIDEVEAIALFGSVARPLETRITRRGWEMLHTCKDVDLAVWIDHTNGLDPFRRARGRALSKLFTEQSIGVAHHQVDVFFIEPKTDRCLGDYASLESARKDTGIVRSWAVARARCLSSTKTSFSIRMRSPTSVWCVCIPENDQRDS